MATQMDDCFFFFVCFSFLGEVWQSPPNTSHCHSKCVLLCCLSFFFFFISFIYFAFFFASHRYQRETTLCCAWWFNYWTLILCLLHFALALKRKIAISGGRYRLFPHYHFRMFLLGRYFFSKHTPLVRVASLCRSRAHGKPPHTPTPEHFGAG